MINKRIQFKQDQKYTANNVAAAFNFLTTRTHSSQKHRLRNNIAAVFFEKI